MGGLVCRAFLQNAALGEDECVDKVFTYATPHNGIDVGGHQRPELAVDERHKQLQPRRMAKYLELQASPNAQGRVDCMPESAFPVERVFCMVGTNRVDYEVPRGLSRTFAGHGSDGLVRIENAAVWAREGQDRQSLAPARPTPTARTRDSSGS